MRKDDEMNEMEQEKALLGTSDAPAVQAGEDWKSKYEEAQRQLASARVEEGRVRKLDADNKALARKLAELERGTRVAAIAGDVSAEERGDVPEEYVGLAARVADTAATRVAAGIGEEIERLRRERDEERAAEAGRRRNEFLRRVNEKYPKLFEEIGPGGSKERAWKAFMDNNKESVDRAYGSCSLDGISYHLDRFYREDLGVPPPTAGMGGAPAPDPVQTSGGSIPAVHADDANRKYTAEEFAALEKRATNLRACGKFKEYRELCLEMDNILSEGRLA